MQKLGILREEKDPRVCFVPKQVAEAVSKFGLKVIVESGAGESSGFHDKEYVEAGASIADRNQVFSETDTILFINAQDQIEPFSTEKNCIGILNPLFFQERVKPYLQENINLYSLDLLPRTSLAQSMDILSSMASLSGYFAVIKAAELYGSTLPMFTTAAGTIYPAKVLILGAGVAGLQAIATAKRLGAVVEAFDVRKSAGEEVRSLGAKFIEVEGSAESESAGGYAVEQTEDYKKKQADLLEKHIVQAGIVISTANIPGRKAPVLITKKMLDTMMPNSVIIDLASAQGGNCEVVEDEKLTHYKDIKILGNSNLSREVAHAASQMLSSNYFSFIKHFIKMKKQDNEDEIILNTRVIEKGKLVNEKIQIQ